MEIPDVIGFPLEEALHKLNDYGFSVDVAVTKPSEKAEPVGIARVIRITSSGGNSLKVLAVFQDYLKGGV